jgi:hypothetical protein
MATLRIFDLDQQVLAADLRHLLELLAPRSLQADWTISPVKSDGERFEATGPGAARLEGVAKSRAGVPGPILAALAAQTHQVVWGEFAASLPETEGGTWVTIRFVDSTFCEITSADATVLDKIKSSYRDLR